MKNDKNRPSADPTRNRILKAAQHIFVKRGYAGSSISQIATKARINQSLIYHHFGNKQQLWKAVKTYLLSQAKVPLPVLDATAGLKKCLEQIVRHRFAIYHSYPDVARMIAWQRLESAHQELIGNQYLDPEHWRDCIVELQKSGQLRPELDPNVVITLIISLIPGAFMASNPLLSANQKYKSDSCIEQVLDCLYRALRS